MITCLQAGSMQISLGRAEQCFNFFLLYKCNGIHILMTGFRNPPFSFPLFHFFTMTKVKRSDKNSDHNYEADICVTRYLIIVSLHNISPHSGLML